MTIDLVFFRTLIVSETSDTLVGEEQFHTLQDVEVRTNQNTSKADQSEHITDIADTGALPFLSGCLRMERRWSVLAALRSYINCLESS